MGTFRLYTGSDGQSHVETIDLAKTPDWTTGLATANITFRSQPPGQISGLASGPTSPVRHYPFRPARNRPGRWLETHLWSWRCPFSGRYHRQGSHHCYAWQRALCDGDCATRLRT